MTAQKRTNFGNNLQSLPVVSRVPKTVCRLTQNNFPAVIICNFSINSWNTTYEIKFKVLNCREGNFRFWSDMI